MEAINKIIIEIQKEFVGKVVGTPCEKKQNGVVKQLRKRYKKRKRHGKKYINTKQKEDWDKYVDARNKAKQNNKHGKNLEMKLNKNLKMITKNFG